MKNKKEYFTPIMQIIPFSGISPLCASIDSVSTENLLDDNNYIW